MKKTKLIQLAEKISASSGIDKLESIISLIDEYEEN